MTNWDKRFLDLAEHFGSWSKDRSRGVGAIIVNEDKRVISIGYNGFPSGTNDDVDERHERPAKYSWTSHGEENAIVNAARLGVSTNGTTMYCNLFPCSRCTGMIINAGIKELVCGKRPNFEDETYGDDYKISLDKLGEAGIEVRYIL